MSIFQYLISYVQLRTTPASLQISMHEKQVLDFIVSVLICFPTLLKHLLRLVEEYVH